jgi:hypothetical protein
VTAEVIMVTQGGGQSVLQRSDETPDVIPE